MALVERWGLAFASTLLTDGTQFHVPVKASGRVCSMTFSVAFSPFPTTLKSLSGSEDGLRLDVLDKGALQWSGQASRRNGLKHSSGRGAVIHCRKGKVLRRRVPSAASGEPAGEDADSDNKGPADGVRDSSGMDQARDTCSSAQSGNESSSQRHTPPTAESVFSALGASLSGSSTTGKTKSGGGSGSNSLKAIPWFDSPKTSASSNGSAARVPLAEESNGAVGSQGGSTTRGNGAFNESSKVAKKELDSGSQSPLHAQPQQPPGNQPSFTSRNSPNVGDPQWRNAFPAYMQSKDNGDNDAWNGSYYGHLSGEGQANGHANGRAVPGVQGVGLEKAVAAAKAAASRAAQAIGRKDGSHGSEDAADSLLTPPSSAAQPPVTAGLRMPDLINDDPIWAAIRAEARFEAEREPLLSSFLYASILAHSCFERSLGFVLANRLKNATLLATQLVDVFDDVLMLNSIRHAIRADVQAVKDRDPSCRSYSSALLYYKGYHALQSYRIAHALWKRGQQVLALAMQSRISEVFAVDIHPAARIGYGILMDHGTGVVIGETAVVGNRVSMLQGVTLGGTGKEAGDRHPKIHEGVLIGAGATVLGNINVGRGAMVAAGSLVLKNVPAHSMVAGTPAKVVGMLEEPSPALTMKHDVTKDFCSQWEEAVRKQVPDELYGGAGI